MGNQSTLNKTHVIEITKLCTVAFIKARCYLVVVVRCRERKKTEDDRNGPERERSVNILMILHLSF